MSTLPSGTRKVYNYFYKRKALGSAYTPTPAQIKEYFESQGFDVDSITDEQFNQAVDYFSKGELLVIRQNNDVSDVEAIPQDNAPSTKSELVRSTAQSLGIVLNTAEIAEIASNVNSSSDDLQDSLEEIKSAIVAFIKYKASLNSEKISQIVDEINLVASSEFSNNSQQLTDGLQSLNRQIQQQNTDFKSQVKSAIAAFAIPPAG